MALLDRIVPANDSGFDLEGADTATAQLGRFGEPAKAELLKRAQGGQPGWRQYAGAILENWPSWSDQDLLALSAALDLDGRWAAHPLAVIGDDEAIDVLTSHLFDPHLATRLNVEGGITISAENVSQLNGLFLRASLVDALAQLAPKSMAKLWPLIESNTQTSRETALSVIREAKDRARPLIPEWTAIATDNAQPNERRIAALRALDAVDSLPADAGAPLRPLLTNPTPEIAEGARKILDALGDPRVAADSVRACNPEKQSRPHFDEALCLHNLERFQASPEIIGPPLLEFTSSRDGEVAAAAIGVIAKVGYKPAEPTLITALGSADWRAAYAAAAALGVLGGPSAVPALEDASRTHWLPEMRRQAQQSLAAIKSGTALKPIDTWEFINEVAGATTQKPKISCKTWRWRGQTIRPPLKVLHSVPFDDGVLTAIDNGEFGGGLSWTPTSGADQVVFERNITALQPVKSGAIALAGLDHMMFNFGFVVMVRRTATGWDVREVAQLPGVFSAISVIDPITYAAWSPGLVVIFTEQGVIGSAECQR